MIISRTPVISVNRIDCVLKKLPIKVAVKPRRTNIRLNPAKKLRVIIKIFLLDALNEYAKNAGNIGKVQGEIKDSNPARNETSISIMSGALGACIPWSLTWKLFEILVNS